MLSDAQRAALAARLRKGRNAALAGIPRRDPGVEVPLSFGQEQLWFIDQFAPGMATYNIPLAVRLRGTLDPQAFRRALDALLARHEALRTRLVSVADGSAVQVVDAPAPVALPIIDLSEVDSPEVRLRELAQAESDRPFDLAAGPLFRATLFRLSADHHVLLAVVHHAVFDGWSAEVLLRELGALYEGAASLPDLPIQFGDYALWERDRLRGEALDTLVGYWRKNLDGAATLHLPTDRPRPMLESHRGGVAELRMEPALGEALRELSKQRGTTLFVTLLTALQVLLHRYSGQDDIVVGTVSANRSRPELAPLIGFLVNTLPIRTDLSGDPTFLELLERVRETTVAAYAHQDLPFARLVEALRIERDPSRTPLFGVSFGSADGGTRPVVAGGVELAFTTDYVEPDTAKFDLAFFVNADEHQFVALGQYATDVFDGSIVHRMLAHYQTLLRGVIENPARRLSELPVLTPAERQREVEGWNDTATELSTGCLHERFESQVDSTPDGIAAVMGQEAVTYRELNAAANRIARWLKGFGAGPEVLIGICLPPSPRRLAVLLGILKAGSGYVPLDPGLPADRLSFMTNDADLAVVVAGVTDGAAPELPDNAQVLSIDRAWPEISALSGENLGATASPANIAYVIYTSGSTGRPKGVVVEHRQAVNFALGMIAHWATGPADRVLQFSSLNFDVSILDIFVALLSGATAVFGSRETLLSPPRLAALMRDQRVTFAALTPAVANLVAGEEFPDLRVLICAGEELPTELMRRLLRPNRRLCNGYGPTEATVLATMTELDGTIEPPPIGLPLPNYQAHVLDSRLDPVPLGVIGELHLGGAGVARGYLNQPELTEARFVRDPFRPGGRLYKTGDLVRRRPDGLIQFTGRVDDQIKIRGLRVELGEIEAALAAHPAVAQAVVAVTADRAGEKQLVGYARTTGTASPDDLRRHLAGWLPAYMVPAHIVLLEKFPLNSSGKIDRDALPHPEPGPAAEFRPPSTLIETALVGIYADLLRHNRIGVDDSFFDAGGNSLQAMRLIGRLRAELAVDLDVTAVFLAPTPRLLAGRIEAVRAGTACPAGSGLLVELSDSSEPPLFLVHALGGTVYGYAPLARELAPACAVHGLQAAGLTGGSALESLPALVSRYVEEIRRARPEGPYRLGGWSMGGLVAFEMARVLEESGAEVELLAMLDPPFTPPEPDALEARAAAGFVADAARTLGWTPTEPPEPGSAEEQLSWLAGRLSSGAADTAAVRDTIGQRFAVFRAHQRMIAGYRPSAAVRARTLLVAAEGSPNAAAQPRWEAVLTGTVSAVRVPGDHYTFLQPPRVRAVAELIAGAVRSKAESQPV
jgi:amino acid adenylation domain-containing protein